MLNWKVCLIPPAYIPDPTHPPESAHRAQLENGESLCTLVWGDGRGPSPFVLQVVFEPGEPAEGADPLPSRFPTVEELHSAVDTILPAGVLLSRTPFTSDDPESRPALYGPAGVTCVQTGVRQGTAAALLNPLHFPLAPGGPHHA